MSAPRVVSVAPASPAERAGIQPGDELLAISGTVPRDVIEYEALTDDEDPEIELRRGHEVLDLRLTKKSGQPTGLTISSALFDRVRTCDNHCDFCFIHQLPKGMRKSLYLKDDDYRLSFLYGNFTTLTRFTELDLERVIDERLSPLFVSIHSTDPDLRARLLRNRRGAVSLRWLGALLDAGIEVHGQIVVCPGVNDGPALDETLLGILDRFPGLATVACVPLGISRYSTGEDLHPHTADIAAAVIDTVEAWQHTYRRALGRPLVFCADEYYLIAGRPFPDSASYDGFPQHENGIGMARAFEAAFYGDDDAAIGVRPGFFAWVDGAPPAGYRAPRSTPTPTTPARDNPSRGAPAGDTPARDTPVEVTVLTGEYGAQVLIPLLQRRASPSIRILPIRNTFFGGNIAVTGLLTGQDVAAALTGAAPGPAAPPPPGSRVLLPDVCLSDGRFLDGMRVEDLPRPVEVVPTDGRSLRLALEAPIAAASSELLVTATPAPLSLSRR